MAVKVCKNCGEPAHASWKECPHCGHKLKGRLLHDPSPRIGTKGGLLVIILACAVMLYLAVNRIGWGNEFWGWVMKLVN